MRQSSDKIFDLIKNDDRAAFEELFHQYYVFLCRYANVFIKNYNVCEDIVQDIYLKLWNQRKNIVINQSIKSYLFSSVRNQSLNFIKSKSLHLTHQNKIYRNSDKSSNTENLVEYNELKDIVDATLQKLPARTAEVFSLSRFENKKYKEIAVILQISIKSVEAEMGKALKVFRESLKNYRK